jgi:hypothetical protein
MKIVYCYPKCSSKDVVLSPAYGAGNNIFVGFDSASLVVKYACCSHGGF